MAPSEVIIVTGASGLAGTHLVRLLSRRYPHRKVIALYGSFLPEEIFPNVDYIRCNLKDWDETLDQMRYNAEVYHCAAIVAFDKRSRKSLIGDNVAMTENVVNACIIKGVKKLVHMSSIAALSREKNNFEEGGLIDEDAQWTNSNSNSQYAKSKYYSELEVWRGIEEGLNAVIINPGIILGEVRDWEKGSSALIHKVAKGLRYYTEGMNGYVDVLDVADVMIRLMESDIHSERFIVVENNYSYRDLFLKIAESLNTRAPYIPARLWMSKVIVAAETVRTMFSDKPQLISKETAKTAFQKNAYNNSKLLKFLPAFTFTPFEESLKRIANSYKNAKMLN